MEIRIYLCFRIPHMHCKKALSIVNNRTKVAERGLISQVRTHQNLFTAGPQVLYTHYLHNASDSRSQRWLRLRPVLSAASVDVTPVGRDHRFLRLLPAPLQLGSDGWRRGGHSSVAAFVFWLWILLKNLVDDAKVPHTHRTQAFICNHGNNRHAWCLPGLSVPGKSICINSFTFIVSPNFTDWHLDCSEPATHWALKDLDRCCVRTFSNLLQLEDPVPVVLWRGAGDQQGLHQLSCNTTVEAVRHSLSLVYIWFSLCWCFSGVTPMSSNSIRPGRADLSTALMLCRANRPCWTREEKASMSILNSV